MINIHTEILPKYQGAHSIVWPIFYMESNTGFTIHEINKSIDGDQKYSLLSVIDNTSCLMGSRLLNRRLNSPSTNKSEIIHWQNCVRSLFEDTKLNDEIKIILKRFPDTERSISRIVRFGPSPRDLLSICQGLRYYFQLTI